MNVLEINSLVLAYLGDAIYEVYVRDYLVTMKGLSNVNELQKASLDYVSAKRQAFFLEKLLERDFFSDIELDIIRRARNYRSGRHPKNCDILTYKHATSLEAVFGYWFYQKENTRIEECMKLILEGTLC